MRAAQKAKLTSRAGKEANSAATAVAPALESEKDASLGSEQADSWLAAIVESSFDAIIGKTLEGKIVSWNRSAEQLFGYGANEMIGQPVTRLIPAGRMHEERETLQSIRAGKTVAPFETVRLTKDGREIEVAVTISPVKDAQGHVIGASKIARDNTARKLTESALQQSLAESERARREVADQQFALNQHSIVAITDVQGTIIYVNEKFCDISKYSRDELIGQNHRILNSGHHPREFFQHMYRAIAAGEVWHGEIKNRAKDGRFYWVDTTIVPTLNDAGKPQRYVAIRTDITDRKLAQLALENQALELARSNRDLEQFAYAASHDLQEPLRAVTGCMQLFKAHYEGKTDKRGDEFIAHAVDGATRMQKLINDLLAFSRVGTRGATLQPVECSQAVDDAVKNLDTSIQESGAVVEWENLPVVLGDLSQLTLLFQNLVGNALKFRGERWPRISIEAHRYGEEWQLSVHDNGIGIEPQYFERIFVMFQRLHTRKEYPGTGMGLALCKRIVERHGGRIWVESEFGKGTTFRFTLHDAESTAALVT